jgi:hypothetical protein
MNVKKKISILIIFQPALLLIMELLIIKYWLKTKAFLEYIEGEKK